MDLDILSDHIKTFGKMQKHHVQFDHNLRTMMLLIQILQLA